ncbi:serine carboxypeptidase S28-domain-containing protein [Xylariaceae sp. FL0804]|nr:serine carboxypeptidase S28-domain-containing protein [Xylariaceae sp. FL0804]
MISGRLIVGLLAILGHCCQDVQARRLKRDADADDTRPRTYKPQYFQQPINHFPENGLPYANETFAQRYFVDDTYYQSGGPVFLYIGGETSGESRFSNLQTGIIQILMQETNGLGVILENRYYGDSYPFETSSTDQLAFLTTAQTIADNAYFAQHVVFDGINGSISAPGTPWILYGGSLAGAQTSFTVKQYGDIFYGGIAASGTVHSVLGYPEWYDPVQKYAPQDCVGRINAIVDKMDMLIANNMTSAVNQLKAIFGLEVLSDVRDFAVAIADPIGNPGTYYSNTWQELGWNDSAGIGAPDFFYFCDNVTNMNAPESVTQVDYALSNYTNGEPWVGLGNYANYFKKNTLPLCGSGDYNACWGTQNATSWADTANSGSRSYLYTSCTEQGAYVDAPKEGPTLLSRTVDTSYEQQWCKPARPPQWAFPAGDYNAIPSTPNLTVYGQYGGLNFSADRLAFVDGSADVWLGLCVHSPDAPAQEQVQTTADPSYLHPRQLINGAGHHWDSYGVLDVAAEPQFIRETHRWQMRVVRKWLDDFGGWKGEEKKKKLAGSR